jgi:NAD(P)-dependent dehydrogenase (short-subunit alcohol dehydrogenase family)
VTDRVVVIFGVRGGIGTAVRNEFLNAGYRVIPINSAIVNFTKSKSHVQVHEILTHADADVVINCVGHFDKNNIETHSKTMDINVGSNWSIIQHYIKNPPATPVKIIMVGSSAYRSGRKSYILYAASKAALYNIWQGACDYFQNTTVTVGLINPVKTRTPLIDLPTSAVCLAPKDVALEILSMASTQTNQLVDMKYPEET